MVKIIESIVWPIFKVAILLIVVKLFLVVVVSGSMEHSSTDDYTSWWEEHSEFYKNKNISLEEFKQFDFQKGLNTGDLIILEMNKRIEVGDVIVFKSGDKHIIHRVVSISPIETRGDANNGQLDADFNIDKNYIKGKAWIRIPYLGYVKIWISELISTVF